MKTDDITFFCILGIVSLLFCTPLIHGVWLYFWVRGLAEYYIDRDQDQVAGFRKRYLHSGKIKRISREEYFNNVEKNYANKEKYRDYIIQNRS